MPCRFSSIYNTFTQSVNSEHTVQRIYLGFGCFQSVVLLISVLEDCYEKSNSLNIKSRSMRNKYFLRKQQPANKAYTEILNIVESQTVHFINWLM